MKLRAPLITSALIVAGMLAVSIWAWPLIPDGARVAVHWGLNNRPNGFAPKEIALLVMPAGAVLLSLLFAFILPLTGRDAIESGANAYEIGWIGGVLLLAFVHVLVVMSARGNRFDVGGDAIFAVALLVAVLGNFLGRTRPNPYVGIRTYWTLTSSYSWDKTNRTTGRMFVATGLATLACLAVAGSSNAIVVFLIAMPSSVLAAVVLSYVYWRRDPEKRNGGAVRE
jgi:uncharacterized membrane protein